MGFLEAGTPLSWEASSRYRDVVKRRGVRQFLQLHKQFSEDVFPKSTLSWGDEVEYCLLNLDVENKVARLYLGAEGVLVELKTREHLIGGERVPHRGSESDASAMLKAGQDPSPAPASSQATTASLAQTSASASSTEVPPSPGVAGVEMVYPEAEAPANGDSKEAAVGTGRTAAAPRLPWQTSSWNPEYGTHMIEAIPGRVYPLHVDSILDLLPSMQVRRKKVQAVLPPGCYVASIGSFPTMGAPERRQRPCCSGMRVSPSCCCGQASGRIDVSAKRGAAGADSATSESAARDKRHPTQTRRAAAPHCCAGACFRPSVGGSDASAVSATTEAAAGSSSGQAADVLGAAVKASPAGDAAAPSFFGTTQGAGGSSPAAVSILRAAAYPSFPSAKTDEDEVFHTGQNLAPPKQVMASRGFDAEAEWKRAVLATELEEDTMPQVGKATSAERDKEKGEGTVAEIREHTAKHGKFRQATNGRVTAATVAEDASLAPYFTVVGVTAYPGDFASPPAVPDPLNSRSRSLFVGDALINPHPRFGTLTANIREYANYRNACISVIDHDWQRRGKKVEILVPLLVDVNTVLPSGQENIPMNSELHSPVPASAICGCSHFAADKMEVTSRSITDNEGGESAAFAEGVPHRERRVADTEAAATVLGRGGAEGTVETDADNPASADPTGKTSGVVGGSGREDGSVSTRETRSMEEYYRQLMLDGRILHDGKFIYMDAMGFGMGMHCVQATFGCPSMREARYLYDQLAVLAPLWLSLSAATPFMRGLLAAVDSRWDVIAASVDCRTDAEKRRLPKSRYGTASLYISDEAPLTEHLSFYNDVPAPVNERAFAALVENGVDEILARHVAFLFVRDPLVIFQDKLLEQKPIRLQNNFKCAAATGITSTAADPGSVATAVPTSSGMCTTAASPADATPTFESSSTADAVSPPPSNTLPPDRRIRMYSSSPPITTRASTRTCTSASRPVASACVPLQQQRDVAEAEVRPQQIHHKEQREEEAREDDAAVVAEAAVEWGIDDGTVYTTTEDFENLQSTNWNSVRFKPPAAFKPWTVPAARPSLADTCYAGEHNYVLGRSSVSSSRRRMKSHRSRRWSCASNSGSWRTRTNYEVDTVSACSGGDREAATDKRKGGMDRFKKLRSRCNSLSSIAAPQPLGVVEPATAGLVGGRSRHLGPHTAGGSGNAGAETARKDRPGRPSLYNQNVLTHAKGGYGEAAGASARRKLPLTPLEDLSSSSSSFRDAVPTSLPLSPASASAGAVAEDCCAAPWRVEFRTPEVQLTDFENAACLSLVSALVQVILEERLDLYIPMSLNDENKRRAVECNSILRQKFWFRNDVRRGTADRSFAEYSLHQILFGVSASRDRGASPLQIQRDTLSSTRGSPRPSSYRSLLSSCASGSTFHSSLSGSPFTFSPFSSCASSAAAHSQAPHCSPCSSIFYSSTPTATVPPTKPHFEITSPFLALQASPGDPPRGCPHLLHLQDIRVLDEYSRCAATPSEATPSLPDVVSASTTVLPCAASPRSAASAPAAVSVCTPSASHATAAALSSNAHTVSTEASLSAASSRFVGLVPLCVRYIEKQLVAGHCSREAAAQYLEYFDFLRHRTEGLVPTDASFLRACLAVHPAYNRDSVISAHACFDICQLAIKVGHGECQVPELFGPFAERAGMRVSADCCGFDNGVPVVTCSFLSHFVSDALKEMLRGHVVEAPDGCWQQKKGHVPPHMRWGATDEIAAGSERTNTPQETRAPAAEAATEPHRMDRVADPGCYKGICKGLHERKTAGSVANHEVLNEVGTETAYQAAPRDEAAAIEASAGLRSGTAEVHRGSEDTPPGLQRLLVGKEPASDSVLPRKTSAECSNASIEAVGTNQEFSRESEAANDESYAEIRTTENPAHKEAAACREQSTAVACRNDATTHSRDFEVPKEKRNQGNKKLTANEMQSSVLEAGYVGKGFLKDVGRTELQRDLDREEDEGEGAGQVSRDHKTGTVAQRGCAATERLAHYPLLSDLGPPSLLQVKSTTENVQAAGGRPGTRSKEEVSWGIPRTATGADGAHAVAQLEKGLTSTSCCKFAAPTACSRPPAIVVLKGGSFAGQGGGSSVGVFTREEKADGRIVSALSGKAAASLRNADTASALRSYLSGPLCGSTEEAGTYAPAAPAGSGAGRKRNCNVYSGWRACASVGVTNEEATGLWLILTSGLHCSWCHHDSGSTSCPSTDDDKESGDEVSDVEIHGER